MFKFKDSNGTQVWLKPSTITSIEHVDNGIEHKVIINTNPDPFFFTPDSEEACRKFMFELFKAMGEEYRYE